MNKNNIIDEIKLSLLNCNKIIIKNGIIERIINLYNSSEKNDSLKILFITYNYISLFNDIEIYGKIYEKMNYKDETEKQLLKISDNLICFKCIINIFLCNKIENSRIIELSKNLKHIPNLSYFNIYGIIY